MNGSVLLDTNIVVALFKKETSVLDKLKKTPTVFVPVTVIAELFYGAFKSQRANENIKRVEEFAGANRILLPDVDTARHYGSLKGQLGKKGKPIPENDIWIAALAKQYDLMLVSRDSHFAQVDGLKFGTW